MATGLSFLLARYYVFDPILAREILNLTAVACVTMLSISPVVYDQALQGVRRYRESEVMWKQIAAVQSATLWDIRQALPDGRLSQDQTKVLDEYQRALDAFERLQDDTSKTITKSAGVLAEKYRNFISLMLALFLWCVWNIADINRGGSLSGFMSVLLVISGASTVIVLALTEFMSVRERSDASDSRLAAVAGELVRKKEELSFLRQRWLGL